MRRSNQQWQQQQQLYDDSFYVAGTSCFISPYLEKISTGKVFADMRSEPSISAPHFVHIVLSILDTV